MWLSVLSKWVRISVDSVFALVGLLKRRESSDDAERVRLIDGASYAILDVLRDGTMLRWRASLPRPRTWRTSSVSHHT
jgi:hypothetical protein